MQFEFESCDYCDDPHELEILVPVLPSSQTRLAICRHPDPLKLSLQRTRNLLKIKKKKTVTCSTCTRKENYFARKNSFNSKYSNDKMIIRVRISLIS